MFNSQDADFFGVSSVTLQPGQMIIWSGTLDSLEEQLLWIQDRAKYHGEYVFTQSEFVEVMEKLKALAETIRKTNQGEA